MGPPYKPIYRGEDLKLNIMIIIVAIFKRIVFTSSRFGFWPRDLSRLLSSCWIIVSACHNSKGRDKRQQLQCLFICLSKCHNLKRAVIKRDIQLKVCLFVHLFVKIQKYENTKIQKYKNTNKEGPTQIPLVLWGDKEVVASDICHQRYYRQGDEQRPKCLEIIIICIFNTIDHYFHEIIFIREYLHWRIPALDTSLCTMCRFYNTICVSLTLKL